MLAFIRESTRRELRRCLEPTVWEGFHWCYSALHLSVRMPDGEPLGDGRIKAAALALMDDGLFVWAGKSGWRLSPVEMDVLRAELQEAADARP